MIIETTFTHTGEEPANEGKDRDGQKLELAEEGSVLEEINVQMVREVLKDRYLTAEEELYWARRYQKSLLHHKDNPTHPLDLASRNVLVEANIRLAEFIASKYQDRGLEFDDLASHAKIGLIRAAEGFDPERGTRFTTYAFQSIRQAVVRAIANEGKTIRIPVNAFEAVGKINRAWMRLIQTLEREPSLQELAKAVDLPTDVVRDLLLIVDCTSLEAYIQSKKENSILKDVITDKQSPCPEREAVISDFRAQLDKRMTELNPNERQVILSRFGLDDSPSQTLEEIGKQMGVTRERARQLEASALKKLRDPNSNIPLNDYKDLLS